MRIEPARSAGTTLISWERTATTDTAFIISNVSPDVLQQQITASSSVPQSQTISNLFLGPYGTVIRTIKDFDGFPPLIDVRAPRNSGYIRVEAPSGIIVTGVVFRTVQDPIVLPAAVAAP